MARIFLTGASGQVGRDIEFALLKQGDTVISSTHRTLDITNADDVMCAISSSEADLVINAAAYTNVERSEDEPAIAINVNALGPRNLAKACASCNIPLIHISTDYVFSGSKRKEHVETDSTKVECEYGRSKLDGESYIINSGCKHLIVRTSWLFGCFGRNFVKIMLSMVQARSEVAVVCDQLGNPTPVRPLAECLVKMANRVLSDKEFDNWGIYHFCGYEPTTWDNFARSIFAHAIQMGVLDHNVNVVSITSDEFKSKAKRPFDSRLNCDKISSVFGITLPYWEDYLGEVIHAFDRERQGLTPIEDYDHTISIIDHVKNSQELFAIVKEQYAAKSAAESKERSQDEEGSKDNELEADDNNKVVLSAKLETKE